MQVLVGDDELLVAVGACLFSGFYFLECVPAFLSKKIFLINELDAVFFGKVFRAFAAYQNVRRFLHHQPGETDRILNVSNVRDCPGFERLAIHDRGVHFIDACGREDRAFAGVEKRIVFERAHRRFGCVQTRTAVLQNFPAGPKRVFDSGAILALAFRRHFAALHRSGPSVNNQSNLVFFRRAHSAELLRLC